jgi:predicted TIM-barrel fold metal-dependent hydrolase
MEESVAAMEPKLDIFPHIFPQDFFERMKEIAETNPGLKASIKRWLHIPVLWDLDARIKMMKRYKGYKQILTLSLPAIEYLAPPEESPELARLANDGMAKIVREHPEQFPAFVASLPMNNVPAALEEMDRAINELGAKGVQIFTNCNGRPMDDPEFFPIFERMSKKYDLPIWVHPVRQAKFADYPTEEKSKYEIWWLFGWPYETAAFMARLVFSGMMEKLPNLKIITHHLGAMAPFLEARIGHGMDQLGTRTSDEDYTVILKRMAKRPVDYFKMFYGDTSINGSASAIRCGLDFYGQDHVLFGTDCPFDPEGGPMFIRENIKAIESLKLKDSDKRKMYFGNAIKMLRLELPGVSASGKGAGKAKAKSAAKAKPAAKTAAKGKSAAKAKPAVKSAAKGKAVVKGKPAAKGKTAVKSKVAVKSKAGAARKTAKKK